MRHQGWRLIPLSMLALVSSSAPNVVVAVDLIQVTGLDGEAIAINPTEVVGIRAPRKHHRVLPPLANCAIMTTDGKFVAVLENCQVVSQRLEAVK
jgi:hypothetical protein